MFQVYATTPETLGPQGIAAYAQRAEAMGYDGLSVPDALHDGLLLAALALNATTDLTVATGVLVAFPRSPMTVAIAAWDLQGMSAGRFELGLGTQIRQNIEQRYSTPWTPPAQRMRDYIEALQAIFDSFQNGARLNFSSENYRFTRLQPFFNPGPIDAAPPPIYLGAVGPLMTAVAGEIADGMLTHPTNTPPRYLREVTLPRLRKGMQRSGRNVDALSLSLGSLVATGPEHANVQREREKQRRLLGFLFSTPAYWPSLALFGWQERGEQLQAMSRRDDWQKMENIIDDEMLDQFVPFGTYDEIADIIKARYAGLARRITFPLPENPEHDPLAARAIARLRSARP